MSLGSATSRQSPAYTGNGTTATYAYGFKVFSEDDLLVIVETVSSGAITTLTKTTDYTVTEVSETSGGNVVLVDAGQAWIDGSSFLATGYKLHIRRKPSLLQETDIRNQGDFYPEAHENQFDKLVMIDQSQQDELDRSVKLPENIVASDFDPTLPADIETAGLIVRVNDSANGFTSGPTTTQIENAETNATAAAASAAAAATSETNAATSETNAAASAASAASALASAFFRDVVYVDNTDSPITIASGDNGKLYSIDSSGGAVAITVPQISTLTLPFNISFNLATAGNNVTITRSGTDTIDGATSITLNESGTGYQLIADDSASPDDWTPIPTGEIDRDTVTTKTNSDTPYTATLDDDVILCDTSSGVLTVNLPTAVGITGKKYKIVYTDSGVTNSVTIDGSGSETIGGYTTTTLDLQNEMIEIVSDGANWQLISYYKPTVYVYGTDNSAGAVSSTTPFDFVEVTDTHGTWSSNTTFTAPKSDYYHIAGCVYLSAASAQGANSYISGTIDKTLGYSGSSVTIHPFHGIVYLTKGQLLTIRPSGSPTQASSTQYHYIRITNR